MNKHEASRTAATPALTILVHVGQVDLVAEEHQPLVELQRRQHQSVGRLAVLAVVVEGLEHELGSGGTRKV